MARLNFYERAAKFGHSADSLKEGNYVSSVISVSSMDELKALLDDGSTKEERAAAKKALMGSSDMESATIDNSNEALLKRVHAHVFADQPLAASDQESLSQAFPLKLMAISAPNVTYPKGETSLGTSQLLLTFNYGTVTMQDQSFVTVYNSTLNYTMDTLIRNGTPPPGRGDFNVLGVTGGTGGQGGQGNVGGNGSAGTPGNCSSAGIAGASGQNGGTGSAGQSGGTGNNGGNGLPSMPATITITNSVQANSIIIFSASGAGGTGGKGGQGGAGGNGGGGGNGATCGCTGSGAGNGGNGGTGGQGGQGGPGGNAVNAAGNVKVVVPQRFSPLFNSAKGIAAPGPGGAGGPGGSGGAGGGAGSGGKHNGNGSGGSTGGAGNAGPTGASGTQSGLPADIIVTPF
jgi:hypothetical protein